MTQTRAARADSVRRAVTPVRVLGVDPGLTRCGIGVVEGVPGRVSLVDVGVEVRPWR